MSKNNETPKGRGRPKKPKKLNFLKGKKLNFDVEDTSVPTSEPVETVAASSNTTSCIIPVPLRNAGENICFFNATAQVFNSLVKYHAFVLELESGTEVNLKMKELFMKMKTLPKVHTYPIAKTLNIPDHQGRNQVDALNVVRLLVENVKMGENGFPDFSFFQVTETTTARCSSCNQESAPHSKHLPLISLDLEKFGRQTITTLLDKLRDPVQRADYKCENCKLEGHCQIATDITVSGDYLILHLKIYEEDNFGQRRKLFPEILIDSELSMHETFDLQGVISHHGPSWAYGHYTSDIRVNETWYHADDSTITPRESFQINSVDGQVPYVVVYKKRCKQIQDSCTNEINNLRRSKRTCKQSVDDDGCSNLPKKPNLEENLSCEIGDIGESLSLNDIDESAETKRPTLEENLDDEEEAVTSSQPNSLSGIDESIEIETHS